MTIKLVDKLNRLIIGVDYSQITDKEIDEVVANISVIKVSRAREEFRDKFTHI